MTAITPERRLPGLEPRVVVAWLVVLFVFTIPFEEFFSIPGLGSLTRLIGLATAPLALLAVYDRGRLRIRMPMIFVAVMTLFVMWNLLTFFWSRAPSATIGAFVTNAQLLAFVWLLSEFCRDQRWLLRSMKAYVLGAIVAFGYVAINAFVVTPEAFRETGRFDPNEFATILALGIPVAAWLVVKGARDRLYLVNALYPLIAVFGIVLAASRGGLLVGVIALAAVPLAFLHIGMLRRTVLFVVVVATVTFVFSVAPDVFPSLYRNIERLGETGEELTEGTLTGRRVIWDETVSLIGQSPIIGLGARAPRFLLAETFGVPRAVHNVFLSITAESGLIGVMLFLFVVVVVVTSALHVERADRAFALILVVALLVAMVPLNIEMRKFTWYLMALVAAMRPLTLRSAHDTPPTFRGSYGTTRVQRGIGRTTGDRI